jgi:hypothetical protein
MPDDKKPAELTRVTAEKGREDARNTIQQLKPKKPGDVQ